MIVLIVSVVYALVGLVATRVIAGHLAWMFVENDYSYRLEQPDPWKWFGAWCCGFVAAAVWPVILVFFLLPTRRGRWIVGAEARAIQKAREKKIAKAERELGIK